MFDVEHFKSVNDTWGHGVGVGVGDDALRHIVQLCQGTLRKEESLGRLRGEEFAVLMPETTEHAARTLAQRRRKLTAGDSFVVSEASVDLTVSIGTAQLCEPILLSIFIIDKADKALYAAKRAGRNRVCCWTTCEQESS
ncbi:MAG: diguanylate cyclase (GGDEF)-like protein [Gammaproteobacteria bacterium]|jgi:diguanylate cyclase (GGDEF)-like protein